MSTYPGELPPTTDLIVAALLQTPHAESRMANGHDTRNLTALSDAVLHAVDRAALPYLDLSDFSEDIRDDWLSAALFEIDGVKGTLTNAFIDVGSIFTAAEQTMQRYAVSTIQYPSILLRSSRLPKIVAGMNDTATAYFLDSIKAVRDGTYSGTEHVNYLPDDPLNDELLDEPMEIVGNSGTESLDWNYDLKEWMQRRSEGQRGCPARIATIETEAIKKQSVMTYFWRRAVTVEYGAVTSSDTPAVHP